MVVLLGWSGGAPLALFYHSQAERSSVTHTPAGDPADLSAAGLIPAVGIIYPGRQYFARPTAVAIDRPIRAGPT